MMNNQIAYYLGSKIFAAILNLVTMAVFVRMGGKETYGLYIIQLAWAYMLYSITMQWLRFSFFACFKQDNEADLIATYLRMLALGFAGLLLMAIIGVTANIMSFTFALGIVILILGLASYEALIEIARTRLQARNVAIGVIMRAVLMLVFGVIVLSYQPSALGLTLSVGAAHLGAAFLLWLLSKNISQGQWSASAKKSLWDYGKPLIPAFGLDALGLQLDRLLLARFSNLETVGIYGAASDLIRQTMIVVAEAIAGAYFTLARTAAEQGQENQARDILGQAFLAYTALTFFAGAFVLRFDRLIFDLLFGAEMGAAIEPIVAFIILSNMASIYRAYYFSQAIYLTKGSHNLLYSDGMQVIITLLSGLTLVPLYGAIGAAIAMFAGQLAGIFVYLIAWKNHYILKLPYRQAGMVVAMAGATYLLSGFVERGLAGNITAALFLNILLFGCSAALIAWRFNILSFRDLAVKLTRGKKGRAG